MQGRVNRMATVARALRHARGLAERERWPRERRDARQRERLTELVAYAAARSRYWAQALTNYDPTVGPGSLPELDKATMMERFDDLVTDRRLRRDALLDHVERVQGDDRHLGRYRAMTTSGSSGRKGLFVYDDAGWSAVCAQFLYFSAILGTRPRVPRLRLAVIGAGAPARVQPIIRLEVSDTMTLTSRPCACGRTLRRIEAVAGRADDVIRLEGDGGAPVAVHPMQFSVVARDRDVVEFQVVQQGARLVVHLVARRDGAEGRVRDALRERLADLGAATSRSRSAGARRSSAPPAGSCRSSSPSAAPARPSSGLRTSAADRTSRL